MANNETDSAEESPAKKSPAKKSPAKRAPGTKTAATKAPAKRSDSGSAPRAEAPRRAKATDIARRAAEQLLMLTGKEPEGVTGLHRSEDGWIVQVEVVEVRRIPDTTDILALYEVEVDSDGDLVGYRRLRRYARGASGDE